MRKRMLSTLAVLLLLVGGIGLVKFFQIRTAMAQGAAWQPPPEAVSTIVAQVDHWPSSLGGVGSVTAAHGGSARAPRREPGAGAARVGGGTTRPRPPESRALAAAPGEAGARAGGVRPGRGRGQAGRGGGRRDLGAAQAQDDPRPVRRRAGAAPGQPGPVPERGRSGGAAAVHGSRLRELLAAPAGRVFAPDRRRRARRRGRHRDRRLRGRDHGDELGRRRGHAQRAGPGDVPESRGPAAARHVRRGEGELRPRRLGDRAAGVGGVLRALWQLGVRRDPAQGSEGRHLPRRRAAVREAGARARRPGVRRLRPQAGRGGRELGRVQAAHRHRDLRQQQDLAFQQPQPQAGGQLMKLPALFIRRPVLAIVVNLIVLIAGLQSIRSLSVRQYPRSDIAVVTVTTTYVGANADLVRGFITTPLERVIASADGIDYIESSSAQNVSTITVHLKLNYDTNAALTQIQAKVAQVRNALPPEAEAPVIDLATADNQFAAMYIGFSSSDLDQNQITDYLTRVVQPKLSSIAGVQRADILGGRTFAMRVWLKPEKMAAMGISPSQVRDALAQNNYLSTLGRTKGSMVSVNLVANTNLQTTDDFKKLVVKEHNGDVVRLGDIADVVLGAENYEQDVRFDGKSATFMGVWVLPNANALDVIHRVRAALPGIQAQLPAGMKAGIPYDATEYIQNAIHEVLKTLAETLLIVICVIFLFLGSVRAVIIPIVAIPISLIGAFFIMGVAGVTINLPTLLAIVCAVGVVGGERSEEQ